MIRIQDTCATPSVRATGQFGATVGLRTPPGSGGKAFSQTSVIMIQSLVILSN